LCPDLAGAADVGSCYKIGHCFASLPNDAMAKRRHRGQIGQRHLEARHRRQHSTAEPGRKCEDVGQLSQKLLVFINVVFLLDLMLVPVADI